MNNDISKYLNNMCNNFNQYNIPRDQVSRDIDGIIQPKYIIEPAKGDKIYFYIEKEFYKKK